MNNIIEAIKSPKVIAGAFATIITGAGVGSIFDEIPEVIKNIYKWTIVKFITMFLLVWQSGQSVAMSLISSAIFWLIIKILLNIEKSRKDAVKNKKIKKPEVIPVPSTLSNDL